MLNYVIVFIVSLGIGYVAYPSFFNMEGAGGDSVQQVTVSGEDGRMTFDIDMNSITQEEMPNGVKIRDAVELRNNGGMTLQLERGYKAKVLGYGGGMIRITDQTGQFSGEVPFAKTDILKAIGKKRMNKVLGIDPEADRKKEEEKQAKLQAEKEARIAAQRKTEEQKTADSKPKAEPKVKESGGPLTKTLEDADLIAAMQESIKKRMVSEFSFDGVLKWETGENETISDVEYQTGFATYAKETIFGKQPVVAKALVRNGTVKKWVYAKTGLDVP